MDKDEDIMHGYTVFSSRSFDTDDYVCGRVFKRFSQKAYLHADMKLSKEGQMLWHSP
jgi:hypothetical protein